MNNGYPGEDSWTRALEGMRLRDAPAALAACQAVLAQYPGHSGAHTMLASLAARNRRHRLATAHALDATTEAGAWPAEHLARLAMRLISVGEYESARRLILQRDPSSIASPEVLAEFALQLTLLEQHPAALAYIDRAIGRGRATAMIHFVRGNCLNFLGRFEAAAEAYEQSLALGPGFGLSHLALAGLSAAGSGAGHRIPRLRRAIATAGNDADALASMHFALFKELDRVGDTTTAWLALEQGLALRRRGLAFDAAAETTTYDRVIEALATVPGSARNAPASSGPVPIFIIGLPRSGTTLLERILGRHEQVQPCGELNDLRMQTRWALDDSFPTALDAPAASRLGSVDRAELGRRYLQHTGWRAAGSDYFTDKNPGNFIFAGLILQALPEARLIHMVREPVDSCFSMLKEFFGSAAHQYSYSIPEVAHHHGNYSRLMAHWHAIAPGRILDVSYEQLVADPEASVRRVMGHCGLHFQPTQLRIEQESGPVSTPSSSQVREPIHSRNVQGWKRYASQLGPLVERLRPQG